MSIQVTMPALSPTMEEGALAKWLIKEGDRVSAGDVIAEIETDKATMEVEAVDEGIVGKLLVAEGSSGVKVNTPIALLLEEGETEVGDVPAAPSAPPASAATPATASPQSSRAVNGARVAASPLARRIAAAKGLDLGAIAGSGPNGRIVRRDVESASPVAQPKPAQPLPSVAAPAPTAASAPAVASAPSAEAVKRLYADRPFEEVALDGMRKTVAARLTEAKQTIPHFYLRRDIELDALLALRGQINAKLASRGVKVSVNDFIIKACALALAEHGACNAVWAGDRILRFAEVDLAVAVAVEGGLFTPVIRNADRLSLSAVSDAMKDLAARARSRKLAPQEYQGGAFAISNLGMFGIDNFDAVINPPHAAILAVGAGVRKPIAREDRVETATVMSVTLSVDHRVIDGALGAQFLQSVKERLEEPLSMLA
ncbi:MAG: pyruvate dehydrogenase complex dihydrolipoamide acetyltransferase [Rubrimonas sp.]|uniref:pyruvate dehydrogenase complex dihydrolipoamide acetyltransferase n=1 Tax=Rubrimonas sp. TaxID=2036015 RepID=UPI002FDE3862